jgi:hypothetical protein
MDVTGLSSVFDFAKGVVDRIWPNKSDPAYVAAQAQLIQAQTAGVFKEMDAELAVALEQIKANAVEAAQPGLHFRDGAGWVCVVAFAVMTLKPLIEWGSILAGHPVSLPQVDTTVAMTMLSGLLGLGGMHVYQQVKQ